MGYFLFPANFPTNIAPSPNVFLKSPSLLPTTSLFYFFWKSVCYLCFSLPRTFLLCPERMILRRTWWAAFKVMLFSYILNMPGRVDIQLVVVVIIMCINRQGNDLELLFSFEYIYSFMFVNKAVPLFYGHHLQITIPEATEDNSILLVFRVLKNNSQSLLFQLYPNKWTFFFPCFAPTIT